MSNTSFSLRFMPKKHEVQNIDFGVKPLFFFAPRKEKTWRFFFLRHTVLAQNSDFRSALNSEPKNSRVSARSNPSLKSFQKSFGAPFSKGARTPNALKLRTLLRLRTYTQCAPHFPFCAIRSWRKIQVCALRSNLNRKTPA